MSRPFIFRDGSIAATSFTSSLPEISVPLGRKKDMPNARKQMLEIARAEAAESGHAEGFEAGQRAGYQAGFDQAYAEGSNQQNEMLRQLATDLQQTHERVESAIVEWFEASERELESIAVEIAERLIGAQLTLDRSFIVESTKEALRELAEANRARIRVNPFDSVILSNAKDELMAATASLRGIDIVSDASIRGGCIIETERGAVDATIDTRLELLNGGMEDAA